MVEVLLLQICIAIGLLVLKSLLYSLIVYTFTVISKLTLLEIATSHIRWCGGRGSKCTPPSSSRLWSETSSLYGVSHRGCQLKLKARLFFIKHLRIQDQVGLSPENCDTVTICMTWPTLGMINALAWHDCLAWK